jgi:hypothetical protein
MLKGLRIAGFFILFTFLQIALIYLNKGTPNREILRAQSNLEDFNLVETINIKKLATAIYWAEGGAKTNHPYGILTKYKTTSPRQACINTINHALKDWNGKGDFIVFLGSRYAPIGADNDPKGLNKNWVRNVRYFYENLPD